MSLIIKGMDMPQDCWECPMFSTWEEVGIFSCILGAKINDIDTRSTNCPLIEIPTPHGDLIDRDTVRDECYKTMEELMQSTTINMSAEALSLLCGFTIINNAPTVIETEDKRTDATADKSSQLTGRTIDDWY